MKFKIIKLSKNNYEVFELLKTIGENENEFKNPVFNMDFESFKIWLSEQESWANGKNLPLGFVPQIIYWFYLDNVPIGMGKIRMGLTKSSCELGGNIGYAIGKPFRGKGYGTVLLKLLISEARSLNLDVILLTVEKSNPASKHVIEKAGGILINENEKRWYFTF